MTGVLRADTNRIKIRISAAAFFRRASVGTVKTFTVGAGRKDSQFAIQFGGVYRNAEVYVNGVFAGPRPFGYASFQYDITSALKFGKENVIAVRVDNSVPAGSRWYSGLGTEFCYYALADGVGALLSRISPKKQDPPLKESPQDLLPGFG